MWVNESCKIQLYEKISQDCFICFRARLALRSPWTQPFSVFSSSTELCAHLQLFTEPLSPWFLSRICHLHVPDPLLPEHNCPGSLLSYGSLPTLGKQGIKKNTKHTSRHLSLKDKGTEWDSHLLIPRSVPGIVLRTWCSFSHLLPIRLLILFPFYD